MVPSSSQRCQSYSVVHVGKFGDEHNHNSMEDQTRPSTGVSPASLRGTLLFVAALPWHWTRARLRLPCLMVGSTLAWRAMRTSSSQRRGHSFSSLVLSLFVAGRAGPCSGGDREVELGYWGYLIDLISLAGSSPAMNDIIVNPTSTLVLSCRLQTSTFVIGQHDPTHLVLFKIL